jgi:synapsin
MWCELKKIQKRLGKDKFPLINQTYYTNFGSMIIAPDFPCVAKVGSFHAGLFIFLFIFKILNFKF